jgi:diadenosine tetraphosphatase ApaH/serine/threonine PP2A family protein phosphatase
MDRGISRRETFALWKICPERVDSGAETGSSRLTFPHQPGEGILACHGTPDDDSTCLLEESLDDGRFVPARREVLKARLASATQARVVLCGHSHRQAVIHGPGESLVLNPGRVGCPVFADRPFAAKLEYRSPHARYAPHKER